MADHMKQRFNQLAPKTKRGRDLALNGPDTLKHSISVNLQSTTKIFLVRIIMSVSKFRFCKMLRVDNCFA